MLKKAVAVVLMLLMMLQASAFAQGNERVIMRLSALKIMKGDETGDFKLNNEITRAEFAAIICRLRGLDDIGKMETDFTDVPKNHWASGYIAMASSMDIIKGVGGGLFEPDEKITYVDAVKMLVCVLGYDTVAQKHGGYPEGYMKQATSLGLLKNADMSHEHAIRGELAVMIDNSLDIQPLELVYGTEETYKLMKETLFEILTDNGDNMITFKGILSETENMSLDRVTPVVRANRVIIDGVEYVSPSNVDEFFGHYVEGYAKIDIYDTVKEIVNISSMKKRNSKTVIYSDEASLADNYIKDESDKHFQISSEAVYIYNGRRIMEPTPAEKSVSYGKYTLLDNTGDDVADIVFLEDAASFVIDRINVNNTAIYFEKNQLYNSRNSYTFDFNDNKKKYFITDMSGNNIPFKNIKVNDVITLMSSKDEAFVTVIISTDRVEGVIEEIISGDKERVLINDEEYKSAGNVRPDLTLGEDATFLLDMYGNITGISGIKQSSYHYGYVIDAAKDNGLAGSLDLKIITGSNMIKEEKTSGGVTTISYNLQNTDAQIFKCAAKIKYSANDYNNQVNSVSAQNISPTEIKNKIVRYTLNGLGEIITLNVFSVPNQIESCEFNADIFAFGGENVSRGFFVGDNPIIVCVPETVKVEKDFYLPVRITDNNAYKTYGIKAEPKNAVGSDEANAEPVDVLVLKMAMDSSQIINIQDSVNICIIGRVWQALEETADNSSSTVYKIELLNNSKANILTTASIDNVTNIAKTLRKGDLIQYTTNIKGELLAIKKIESIQGLDRYFIGNDALYGLVYDVEYDAYDYMSNKKVDWINVSFGNAGDDVRLRIPLKEGPPIYLYDRKVGYIYAGTSDDILPEFSKVFALMDLNEVRALVIIND